MTTLSTELTPEKQVEKILQELKTKTEIIEELRNQNQRLHEDIQHVKTEGWLVSGPQSTSIVFSRSRIEDHIKAICQVNGDQPEHYRFKKVKVFLFEKDEPKQLPF